MTLRVALVGGPMYDHLYTPEVLGDVEVVVHADHPTLNHEVARMLADGERIDVLATHSKYAPSQRRRLRPLQDVVDSGAAAQLAPAARTLCEFDGDVLCMPRLIDVRIVWSRVPVPATWDELIAGDVVFGFPGRESGLFGTFFELVTSYGGTLFDADVRPTMDTPEARHAVQALCALAARAPADLPDWHYDQVDAALLAGRVDAAGVWPGGAGPVRAAGLALRPYRYPAGPSRWASYAGCHAWAIPTSCAELDGALDLIHRLIGAEASTVDAAGGTMVANVAALAAVEPVDEIDAERLAITRDTIAEAMITYPPLERFPEIEDAGWSLIRSALIGDLTPAQVAPRLQQVAESVLA